MRFDLITYKLVPSHRVRKTKLILDLFWYVWYWSSTGPKIVQNWSETGPNHYEIRFDNL
jgi:hypothetical protein